MSEIVEEAVACVGDSRARRLLLFLHRAPLATGLLAGRRRAISLRRTQQRGRDASSTKLLAWLRGGNVDSSLTRRLI